MLGDAVAFYGKLESLRRARPDRRSLTALAAAYHEVAALAEQVD